jgi:hypothetical protein
MVHAGNAEGKMTVVHGEPEHIPEEQWLDEIVRIDRRRTKEKARKATQLQRQAELSSLSPSQVLCTHHYRTEPSPRQPRPFTTPKAATPRTASSAHAATDAGLRSVMTAEDKLLEDEYERICMVQAHTPWAEI